MRYYKYYSWGHRARQHGYRDPGVMLGAGRLIARWIETAWEAFPHPMLYIPMVDRSTAALATAVRMYTDIVEPVLLPTKKCNGETNTSPIERVDLDGPVLFVDDYLSSSCRTLRYVTRLTGQVVEAVAVIDSAVRSHMDRRCEAGVIEGSDEPPMEVIVNHQRKCLMDKELACSTTKLFIIGPKVPVDGRILEPVPS